MKLVDNQKVSVLERNPTYEKILTWLVPFACLAITGIFTWSISLSNKVQALEVQMVTKQDQKEMILLFNDRLAEHARIQREMQRDAQQQNQQVMTLLLELQRKNRNNG